MGIRTRGSTFQVDFMHKGQRIRKDGFKTRDDAETWEEVERSRLKAGLKFGIPMSVLASTGCDSVQELYDLTYEAYWQDSKNEECVSYIGEVVIDAIGRGMHPNSITTHTVDRMISEWRKAGMSGGTINRHLSVVSRMLRYAHKRGWIAALPHIERQKENAHRIRWYSDEEEKDILGWFESQGMLDMRDLVLVLIDSGLRLSEALALTWADVQGGWIDVHASKNGKPRRVPQTSRFRDTLADRRKRVLGDHIFPGLRADVVEKQWPKMRKALGKEADKQFVMHTLRHTFCSRLTQRGVQLQTIQQLAGHKNIQTTLRYAHMTPDNLVKAMEVLQ